MGAKFLKKIDAKFRIKKIDKAPHRVDGRHTRSMFVPGDVFYIL